MDVDVKTTGIIIGIVITVGGVLWKILMGFVDLKLKDLQSQIDEHVKSTNIRFEQLQKELNEQKQSHKELLESTKDIVKSVNDMLSSFKADMEKLIDLKIKASK